MKPAEVHCSPRMIDALKSIAELGTGVGFVAGTAKALERRGLATVVGQGPLSAITVLRLTEAGKLRAIVALRAEHRERVATGDRSERIPRILARLGTTVEAE